MDISGSYDIPAPRPVVWAAINDPDVLKACIPGCDELVADGDNGFAAKVTAKIGPVKATFSGAVRLEDVDAPSAYTILGEGKGGAAGFAKGQARVTLEDITLEGIDGGCTRLSYTADAQIGGKLAQIGSRLVQGAAKKYADDFFAALVDQIAPPPAEVTAQTTAEPTGQAPETAPPMAEVVAEADKPSLWKRLLNK